MGALCYLSITYLLMTNTNTLQMTQNKSVARFSDAQSQMNHFSPLFLFPYFKHFLLSSSLFGSLRNHLWTLLHTGSWGYSKERGRPGFCPVTQFMGETGMITENKEAGGECCDEYRLTLLRLLLIKVIQSKLGWWFSGAVFWNPGVGQLVTNVLQGFCNLY